jgi:flagellar biosynthesis protein FlhA
MPGLAAWLPDWLIVGVRKYAPGSDIGLALGVVALLSVLVLPLPPFLLDIGLATSITASVLVLMVALFLTRPLDFSSFPTLLLLTTLLRLSLNVATTRLMLSHGNEGMLAAGHVVAAFGGFLMAGDVVIGLILFCILLVVNFMVITKGSGRIAEVAARFSLDSMPGKQMAIDADMSAGLIDEKTARTRRRDLEQESSFYGAMDGAAKFVRGDAIAGLIITAINIVGGLLIGVISHHMAFADAVATFTTLSAGDGLVAQIPSLLVSTAAGIVVTKGGVEGTADVALVDQLGRGPKPLAMAAGAAAVLGLLPGLPTLPFLAIAGLAGGGAWLRYRHPVAARGAEPAAPALLEPPIGEALRMDMIRLELGYGLLALAGGDGPRLTEQIKSLRRSIAADMGFVLPPVRIQDNMRLGPTEYVISVKEIEAGRGQLRPAKLMAMDPKGGTPALVGEATNEPAFGLPAMWIDPSLKEEALFRGCTVVDPPTVLSTHLTEVVRQNVAELLMPSTITAGAVQRVLQSLLEERVSIRDLPTILEGIQEACGAPSRAIPSIVAHVRARLARQISAQYTGTAGYIPLLTLSADWETAFAESLTGPPEERQLAMAPGKLQDFVRRLNDVYEKASSSGELPVLLSSASIRAHVRAIVERVKPGTAVLSQPEIFPRARIRTVGTV